MSKNQKAELKDLENQDFDLIIVGGGATGLGIGIDSITRGYKTLLIEKFDYAKGTSSRSTKLIHGGVRYLAQFNLSLVKEALHEQVLLEQNAPHLLNKLGFIIPIYNLLTLPYYYIGLSWYHTLLGKDKKSKYKTKLLSKSKTIEKMPNIKTKGLKCSVLYYDNSFDDARMAISMFRTFTEKGGIAFNYTELIKFTKTKNGKISGAIINDTITKEQVIVNSKCIINATGIFADKIRKLDDPNATNIIKPSQGTHIVINKNKFNTECAMLIPKTSDNRILFTVPWYNGIVCGSTDILVDKIEEEPKGLDSAIEFIIDNMNNYLDIQITKNDILSTYTGIRPLIADSKKTQNTSKISRNEKIFVSKSNLITIAGGKYTTYRKMAEKVLKKAIEEKLIPESRSITENLRLHGYIKKEEALKIPEHFRTYGSDFKYLSKMQDFNNKIHKDLPLNHAQITFAIEFEQAKTVEDILSRRTRSLFLNAKATIEATPKVAEIMMYKLGKSEEWKNEQIKSFKEIAIKYLV
ncbi:glycerol-3-phosphate dehydrogenase/oxidase [Borrelia miyamotoi]|uniref:Glycerol-3-phosphate dehydrogenase/oxidase n=1 Tax=Borrelia miyamotoi TaxID=47466 RepID=A0AAX3JNH3_9SPIR|nr:glycerol-3-phosphate dehydrogenase/oxidase [Borrelia miyamotoi]QFP42075.1 glycerol-3-phosphate dehydrogenase/oxidase [Borrelia miyamotoi]QFP48190.1 glycerol-3-phosphate dehydrogenase/oxidase [Borrelia miyamotoi]QGT55949.1 FAD-dependent oxidoreductase [Borrelia miyamotoi]QGT56729.1 FAD-dependent oxidoreductase [Borrelia miyamotoi]WAZ71990.1 glycerol-3-phosphate dehydrogenase/oxidase [Borrelia miyamotoi]